MHRSDVRKMGVVPVVRNEMLYVKDGNENGTVQKPKDDEATTERDYVTR